MPGTSEEDRLHHLTIDRKGRWEIRITVDQGKKIVGKPVRIRLGRVTEDEAIKLRDQHLRALAAAGVKMTLRKQRRRSRQPGI